MEALNLYLIDRVDGTGYDETTSAVVAASNVRQVRSIMATAPGDQSPTSWAPGNATVTLIGTARTKTAQIVHSEYRPG